MQVEKKLGKIFGLIRALLVITNVLKLPMQCFKICMVFLSNVMTIHEYIFLRCRTISSIFLKSIFTYVFQKENHF